MNNLRTIKSIVSKLTSEEEKILTKYLNYYSGIDKTELKSVKLIELLKSKKNYSVSEIQKYIYGKTNYYAFNKLINRLKQKIFEIISFESSLSSNNYSKRNLVLLDLRKKLLQADILQLKGLRNDILPLYNQIIKRARKFELYDIQVQALSSKQRLQSNDSKFILFNKVNEEIEFAENCLQAVKNSNNIYKEISNKIINANSIIDYEVELLNAIKNLEENYRIFNSSIIGFYLYTLSAEMWQNKFNYDRAQSSLETVKDILNKNEAAFTENRYGTILLNLSNNNIFLYQFDEAIQQGNESKKYFKKLPYTLKIVDEILFYSYFYKFDFINSFKVITDNQFGLTNEKMKIKFNYFQASLYFMEGKNNESLATLVDLKEIEKDKEGWNINRRILLILNRVELQDYESVDLQMQNLEQFIKRISKNKIIRPRYTIILRILSKLVKENYNFKETFHSKSKYFSLLESSNLEYKWEIKSPELIIFTDWFKAKIFNSQLNSSLIKRIEPINIKQI